MEIKFYGASCFEIVANKTSFVIDFPLKNSGISGPKIKDAVLIQTVINSGVDYREDVDFLINTPGEFEVGGMAVRGMSTKAMMAVHDSDTQNSNIAYSLRHKDVSLAVMGLPSWPISEDTLETLGTIDILIVPVGGGGLSLDAVQAAKLVKEIEPKIVIPCHYAQKGVSYPVPQDDLKKFIEELGIEPKKEDKLKIKSAILPETTELVVLES